jgi:hypothetical protein
VGFAEPPADLTPPADVAPPKAFETYIAPPPSRPPTSEPKLTPPPVEAVAPVGPAPEPAPALVAETMMPQQVRQAPPAPPAAPKERSSNRRFVVPAAIAGGVAVVAVIGVVLAGGGGGADNTGAPAPSKPKAATTGAAIPVSASGIALKVPTGWSDGGDTSAVPGLAAGAVTMGGPKGATIAFGKADASAANSTLLPDDLRTAELPAGTPADLSDGVQALRYDNLKLGDKTGSVFAVPTTNGVATLACIAPTETCSAIASSLRITDGKAFPVGPSTTYSADLERTLGRLEKQEKSAASALDKAGKRTSQVAATGKLASAYSGAASSLRKLDHSPADTLLNAQLVAALTTAGGAYKKAAGDGSRKDRAGYQREGSKALAARKDMTDALAGLSTAGYTLPASLISGAGSFTRLPTLIKDKPKKQASTSSPSASSPSTSTQPQTPQTQTPTPRTQTPTPRTQTPAPKPQTPKPKPKTPVTGGGEG